MFLNIFCNVAHKFIMNSRNMKHKSNFKLFKVIKSRSKPRLSHYPLSKTFNDKFWKSRLYILYLSTWHNNRGCHIKNSNLNNTLLLLLGVWPPKKWFWYLEHFICILAYACSHAQNMITILGSIRNIFGGTIW